MISEKSREREREREGQRERERERHPQRETERNAERESQRQNTDRDSYIGLQKKGFPFKVKVIWSGNAIYFNKKNDGGMTHWAA